MIDFPFKRYAALVSGFYVFFLHVAEVGPEIITKLEEGTPGMGVTYPLAAMVVAIVMALEFGTGDDDE